jgi:hypothetical protein
VLVSNVGTGQYLHIYKRIANAEPASYTWVLPDSAASLTCVAFRYTEGTYTLGTIAIDANMSSYTSTEIVTVGKGMLLSIAQVDAQSSFTTPSGFLETVDFSSGEGGNQSNTITICRRKNNVIGATGNVIGTGVSAAKGTSILLQIY